MWIKQHYSYPRRYGCNYILCVYKQNHLDVNNFTVNISKMLTTLFQKRKSHETTKHTRRHRGNIWYFTHVYGYTLFWGANRKSIRCRIIAAVVFSVHTTVIIEFLMLLLLLSLSLSSTSTSNCYCSHFILFSHSLSVNFLDNERTIT